MHFLEIKNYSTDNGFSFGGDIREKTLIKTLLKRLKKHRCNNRYFHFSEKIIIKLKKGAFDIHVAQNQRYSAEDKNVCRTDIGYYD